MQSNSTNKYIIALIVSTHTEDNFKFCSLDLRSSKAWYTYIGQYVLIYFVILEKTNISLKFVISFFLLIFFLLSFCFDGRIFFFVFTSSWSLLIHFLIIKLTTCIMSGHSITLIAISRYILILKGVHCM